MTATVVTASALGRHLDLSRQRIVQLADEGVIERRLDDRFDQDAARVAYVRWLRSEDRRAVRTEADGRLRDRLRKILLTSGPRWLRERTCRPARPEAVGPPARARGGGPAAVAACRHRLAAAARG